MLSGIAKFLLALTALSPAGFTWVVGDFSKRGYQAEQMLVLATALFFVLSCLMLLRIASRKLTKVSFTVKTIKVIDNEVVAYIVTYLFPLVAPAADISVTTQIFVLLVLALVLSTSHAFTFNPILTFAGYHFYEAECSTGVTYLLLSKNDITDVKKVQRVGRLSKHLVVDLT
jgi:hypothetical protein